MIKILLKNNTILNSFKKIINKYFYTDIAKHRIYANSLSSNLLYTTQSVFNNCINKFTLKSNNFFSTNIREQTMFHTQRTFTALNTTTNALRNVRFYSKNTQKQTKPFLGLNKSSITYLNRPFIKLKVTYRTMMSSGSGGGPKSPSKTPKVPSNSPHNLNNTSQNNTELPPENMVKPYTPPSADEISSWTSESNKNITDHPHYKKNYHEKDTKSIEENVKNARPDLTQNPLAGDKKTFFY
jgi:hypothetical protein